MHSLWTGKALFCHSTQFSVSLWGCVSSISAAFGNTAFLASYEGSPMHGFFLFYSPTALSLAWHWQLSQGSPTPKWKIWAWRCAQSFYLTPHHFLLHCKSSPVSFWFQYPSKFSSYSKSLLDSLRLLIRFTLNKSIRGINNNNKRKASYGAKSQLVLPIDTSVLLYIPVWLKMKSFSVSSVLSVWLNLAIGLAPWKRRILGTATVPNRVDKLENIKHIQAMKGKKSTEERNKGSHNTASVSFPKWVAL